MPLELLQLQYALCTGEHTGGVFGAHFCMLGMAGSVVGTLGGCLTALGPHAAAEPMHNSFGPARGGATCLMTHSAAVSVQRPCYVQTGFAQSHFDPKLTCRGF